jgi:hypothetical protein
VRGAAYCIACVHGERRVQQLSIGELETWLAAQPQLEWRAACPAVECVCPPFHRELCGLPGEPVGAAARQACMPYACIGTRAGAGGQPAIRTARLMQAMPLLCCSWRQRQCELLLLRRRQLQHGPGKSPAPSTHLFELFDDALPCHSYRFPKRQLHGSGRTGETSQLSSL